MPLAEVAQRLAAFEEDSELTEAIKGFFRILEPYVETHEVLMVAGLHGNRPFGVGLAPSQAMFLAPSSGLRPAFMSS